MDGISVIVPCHNEESSITETIKTLIGVISNMNLPSEIIVVDDASEDKTKMLINNFGDSVKTISNERQLGYGGSIKRGISKSRYGFLIIIDADGTYPSEAIRELFKVAIDGDYDMVVGARTKKNTNVPLINKMVKWFITKFANYLSGEKIPDLNSGLRLMKKEAVEKFMHILPDGFSFTTTITLAMLANGYRVKFIPVDYFKRKGKSKIKPIQDTFNFIQLIIRTTLYFNPLKIFVPLSILLVIIAFFVLIASRVLWGRIMDVTFGVIIMSAVITMAIGMLADLIDKRIR